MAMESRAYTGGEGRTRLKPLKAGANDILIFTGVLLFFAAVITAGCLGY